MYYAIYCLDSENGAAARQQSREAHMAYLKDEPVKFLTAGPLMDKAGGGMVGSLFIIEADSYDCLLYTSPSPRDRTRSRMPSSA